MVRVVERSIQLHLREGASSNVLCFGSAQVQSTGSKKQMSALKGPEYHHLNVAAGCTGWRGENASPIVVCSHICTPAKLLFTASGSKQVAVVHLALLHQIRSRFLYQFQPHEKVSTSIT